MRTCPLCRSSTWFITPSTTWPLDSGEKEGIMDSYKKRLAGIDCKHFDQGRGRCPFGSSCFYRHSDEHGKPMVCPSIGCFPVPLKAFCVVVSPPSQ